jgi:Uri superfamily endonuclease
LKTNRNRKRSKTNLGTRIRVLGDQATGGTYVLRIRVRRDLSLAFGKFRGGMTIKVARGEYLYVGSALAERGSTALACRLVRHATRSDGRYAHGLRKPMVRYFQHALMVEIGETFNAAKRLHWHVDYLLDYAEVELIGVYALRSPARIEGKLANLLENDLSTSIVEKGLGASDIPGNTHLLRVEADELWWRLLPSRIHALAIAAGSSNLAEAYLRGKRCVSEAKKLGTVANLSFAKHQPARVAASTLAYQLAVAEAEIVHDAKFSMLVDSIIEHCGAKAVDAIFSVDAPQSRKDVERLARTSDVRQHYRIDGFLAGTFRSLGPQGDDPVFDTVRFSEVVSRLGRAAGLLKSWGQSVEAIQPQEARAVRRLLDTCHVAATTLLKFLTQQHRPTKCVAGAITRKGVNLLFAEIAADRGMVGELKAALKLTVKNVWDFDQMAHRGIVPTVQQHSKALALISTIVNAAEQYRR